MSTLVGTFAFMTPEAVAEIHAWRVKRVENGEDDEQAEHEFDEHGVLHLPLYFSTSIPLSVARRRQ